MMTDICSSLKLCKLWNSSALVVNQSNDHRPNIRKVCILTSVHAREGKRIINQKLEEFWDVAPVSDQLLVGQWHYYYYYSKRFFFVNVDWRWSQTTFPQRNFSSHKATGTRKYKTPSHAPTQHQHGSIFVLRANETRENNAGPRNPTPPHAAYWLPNLYCISLNQSRARGGTRGHKKKTRCTFRHATLPCGRQVARCRLRCIVIVTPHSTHKSPLKTKAHMSIVQPKWLNITAPNTTKYNSAMQENISTLVINILVKNILLPVQT